jgi:hypothetical protein
MVVHSERSALASQHVIICPPLLAVKKRPLAMLVNNRHEAAIAKLSGQTITDVHGK